MKHWTGLKNIAITRNMNTLQPDTTDLSKKEKFFFRRVLRYSARSFLLFIFSVIFKSFDLTFVEDLSNSLRSQVFSLVFIVFGLLAWEGGAVLSHQIEKHWGTRNIPYRLLALFTIILVYGILVSLGFAFVYGGTDLLIFNRQEAWKSVMSLSYNMIFGTFLFYLLILSFNGIIFYYKVWKEYQLQTARLQKENIQAKYDALRNQIDPHFFFNSLSVLTNLVYKSPDLSAEYITQLAKIYRYILDKKFENLVSLRTELDFLNSYLFLINIR